MTKGSVCVCLRGVERQRESSHHFASKELTSHRESTDEGHVEMLQSFVKAVEAFFFIFLCLTANLALRLLWDSCITTLLVVAPVEELHDCGREDNAR